MKKTTKGAIAAGAAAVLLAGGAGTMAAWNSSADITGGSVEAGELKITAGENNGWKLNDTGIADISDVLLVPGDVLSYSGDYTIAAKGTNLAATLTSDVAGLDGDFGDTLTVDTNVEGVEGNTITAANNGETITATTTLTFEAEGEDAQGATANLNTVTITLQQN